MSIFSPVSRDTNDVLRAARQSFFKLLNPKGVNVDPAGDIVYNI